MARLRLRDVYCVCLDSWDHMSGALLGVEMVVGGLESLASTLISFADKALELLLNHRVMVFPQFMSAQMAMSYLVESLLRMLDANRQAVGECRALLEAASRMPNERDALNEISELMPVSVRAVRAERRVRRAAPARAGVRGDLVRGLQAHAVSEMERSRRVADVLGFLKHGWDSAMANVVPVVHQVFESQFDRRAGTSPSFAGRSRPWRSSCWT